MKRIATSYFDKIPLYSKKLRNFPVHTMSLLDKFVAPYKVEKEFLMEFSKYQYSDFTINTLYLLSCS